MKRPVDRKGRPAPLLAAPTFVDLAGDAGAGQDGPVRALGPVSGPGSGPPGNVLLASHLLRRAGFGSTPYDLKNLSKKGTKARTAWINAQLNPSRINDAVAEAKLPGINPDNYDNDYIRKWFMRMIYSQRQLQEKMTLIWHEHFAVSNDKVGEPFHMSQHEELLRSNALGNFQTLLQAIVKDNAMLAWLDNSYNNGNNFSCGITLDQYCPPNENFAREFMQLYTLGTKLLDISGQPILDAQQNPIPPYNENDVKILSRAFTGWYIDYCGDRYPEACARVGLADDDLHDIQAKMMFGNSTSVISIPASSRTANGTATINETNFVIDQMLNGDPARKSSISAFIAQCLLQKLATENPSPQYTQAVAIALRDSRWDIKEAVRAIFMAVDPATGSPFFENPSYIRTMYKDPVEQYIGSIRALYGNSDGDPLIHWSYFSGQLIWYPPSVFSFYRPGQKSTLVSTAYVLFRDQAADEFINRYYDMTTINISALIKKGKLTASNRQGMINYLATQLVGTSLHPEVNTAILNYLAATPDASLEDRIRSVVYLILISPDFQRN